MLPVDVKHLDWNTNFQVRSGLSYNDFSKENSNIDEVNDAVWKTSRKMRQFGKRTREDYEAQLQEENDVDEDQAVDKKAHEEKVAAMCENPVTLCPVSALPSVPIVLLVLDHLTLSPTLCRRRSPHGAKTWQMLINMYARNFYR